MTLSGGRTTKAAWRSHSTEGEKMAAAKKKSSIVALCATSVALGMGASVAQADTVILPFTQCDPGAAGVTTAISHGAPVQLTFTGGKCI